MMSLLFDTLSRFAIALLPRGLQSLATVILEPKKIKSVMASTSPPLICYEVTWLDAMLLVFLMLSFKPAYSLSSFIKKKKNYFRNEH